MSNRWRRQWERQGANDPRRGFANPWIVQQRTRLGVTAMKASPVLDAQLGLRGRGIVVATVGKNTLASRLGLQRYDILLELNGVAIRGVNDVTVALKRHKQGEKLTATVIRRTAETKLETK
jgi:S1-C subfamily serine protease